MKVLRHLLPAAEFERDQRAATYPAYVERGLIKPEDAQADYQAWCAIALWLAGEEQPWSIELEAPTLFKWDPERLALAEQRRDFDWPSEAEVMRMAAGRAVGHLAGLSRANPDDVGLKLRLARIEAVRDGLQRYWQFCEGLTRELRARARAERSQAA